MAYTHSFADVRPPARYDDPADPWTHVRVEEGLTAAGPWTQIEELAIAPDPTPESPAPLDLTVTSAVESGWYRFRFRDASGDLSEYSTAVANPSDIVGPSGYRPALADLGAIMRARTKDNDQVELGTFTADTRPTGVEADLMIDQASALVATRLGSVPRRLGDLARAIVALRAAMYVEVSYYPEDTDTDQSAYARYREQYNDAIAAYDAALEGGASYESNQIYSLRIGTFYTTPFDPNDPYDTYESSALLP